MAIAFQDLVVGDEPCTYKTICNTLTTSASVELLWSKMIDLSRTLGVPEGWNQMTTPWLLNKNKPHDSIFIEMLDKWRAQTGQKATLEALIFALEFNGLHTFADDLKNRFYDNNICTKMENITDSTTWNDLSNNLALEFRKKVVIFQGKQVKLDDCIDDHSLSKIDSTLLNELSNDKSPILVSNQVPEGLPYYIQRRLKMRNKLDKEIFQNDSNDIILVQGITRMKLSSLVESPTDLSGNQIPQHKITARYLVLEFEDDFDRISKIATEPVHWIKFKNESYYWVKSSGPVQTLQQYLHVAQDSFHEAKLVTGKDKVILISDSPGMGKSMLLSNIANQIQKERPTTVVRFIVLKEFLELLGNQTISIGSIISALTEDSSKFPLGREIVKRSLTENGVLVFDGFDEVLSHQIDSCKQILQSVLVNLKSVRVFVSTRPQFLEELENTFYVLGQTIDPLKENDAINLLKLHWNSNGHDTGVDLVDFAKSCLKSVTSNLTDFEKNIAGIPLQCRMLAEIYEDEAKKSIKEDYNVDGMDRKPISFSSIFQIYDKLMSLKLARFVSRVEKSDLPALCRQERDLCTHSEEAETQFTAIRNAHIHFALKLMFPVHLDLLPLPTGSKIISPKALSRLGILEAYESGEIRFVHRTFAEYFIAKFVVDQFNNNGATREFILSNVLKTSPVYEKIELPSRGNGSIPIDIKSFTFCYPVIAYFIDGFSKKMFHGKHQLDNILTPMDLFAYFHCSSIFFATAYHRYRYLLPYLYKILKEGNYPATIKRKTYAVNVKEIAELLLIVAKYATVDMMKIFCQRIDITDMQFTKLIDFSHDTLETSKDVGYGSDSSIGSGFCDAFIVTPLHVAVQRGHYSIVEYLLSTYGSKVVEQKFLLHFCVFASLRDSKDVINQKIKIIKLLTTKSQHFLDEQLADNLTPLLQKNVHPELVEYLIQEGADVNFVDRVENNVLHRISENFLAPEAFHRIVQFLNENKFHLFNTSNFEKRTPLHLALKNIELKEETLGVFMLHKVDFNAASFDGHSVLMHAIAGRRSDRLLRQLIRFGANWKHINKKNENMLHVSVTFRNCSALRYFLEHHELDLGFRNSDLMTPLHVAVSRLSETNETIQQLLIDSGTNMNVVSDDYRMSPFIQAFTVGEGLSLNIIKSLEVRGFNINNKLASEALQAAFQNKKIIPDGEFIKVLEYLISKRGQEEQPTSWSPWVKVKEKVQDIIEHTKLDSSLMRAIKNHSLLSEDEMLQISQTTESKRSERLYDIVQQAENSFEKLCLSLLQCKQLYPYYLLKKCVESELQSLINRSTPIRDSNMSISSSPYQFDLTQSDRDESPFPNNQGNFIHCHPNFSKFMDSADTLLIIETPFPEVSYKRIADTSHVPVSELLKELPMQQNISRDVLYIVYITNMEFILKAREIEKSKMILLTEENKESLENKLGSQKGLQIYRDRMKWSDLSSTFQEEMMKSCDILEKMYNNSLQHLLCDDILFGWIQNPSKGTFANNLSPHIKYYIDRKIVSRNVVSKQDFGSKEKYKKFVSMIETEYSESEFLEMLEKK